MPNTAALGTSYGLIAREPSPVRRRDTASLATTSRLLKLPAELRNQIYHFALVEDEPVRVSDPRLHRRREPSLLSVCRQIRDESTEIYYGANNFAADDTYHCKSFLTAIGAQKAAMLRTVHLWSNLSLQSLKFLAEGQTVEWGKDQQ